VRLEQDEAHGQEDQQSVGEHTAKAVEQISNELHRDSRVDVLRELVPGDRYTVGA